MATGALGDLLDALIELKGHEGLAAHHQEAANAVRAEVYELLDLVLEKGPDHITAVS